MLIYQRVIVTLDVSGILQEQDSHGDSGRYNQLNMNTEYAGCVCLNIRNVTIAHTV